MSETRVYTVIETEASEDLEYHFEWFGSKTVIVTSDDGEDISSFSFMDQPTLAQVVEACEGWEYVDERTQG
jgi:hypothetical protein